MQDDDIYHSRRKYERWLDKLDELTDIPPSRGSGQSCQRKYVCKIPANLEHFRRLATIMETRDTSFVRRLRLCQTLLFIVHHTEKDLSECDRNDIDYLVRQAHQTYKTRKSKEDFLRDLKFLWRQMFPEVDEQGRPDSTLTPYVVRHIRSQVDRSRERLSQDRLTWQEYEQLVSYFSNDLQMQAYLTLAVESLGRPQELCLRTIGDLELYENYAKIWVSSRGKEGVKPLQCIDSYPYLLKWLACHPAPKQEEAYLFLAGRQIDNPLKPNLIARKLRRACQALGLKKRVTAYSMKRNGITYSRLRGDADVEIQHRAGWRTSRQLHTYDQSTAEDAFQRELVKRGLVVEASGGDKAGRKRLCVCGERVGFADHLCPRCSRPVDPQARKREIQAEKEIKGALRLAIDDPDLSFREIVAKLRESRKDEIE